MNLDQIAHVAMSEADARHALKTFCKKKASTHLGPFFFQLMKLHVKRVKHVANKRRHYKVHVNAVFDTLNTIKDVCGVAINLVMHECSAAFVKKFEHVYALALDVLRQDDERTHDEHPNTTSLIASVRETFKSKSINLSDTFIAYTLIVLFPAQLEDAMKSFLVANDFAPKLNIVHQALEYSNADDMGFLYLCASLVYTVNRAILTAARMMPFENDAVAVSLHLIDTSPFDAYLAEIRKYDSLMKSQVARDITLSLKLILQSTPQERETMNDAAEDVTQLKQMREWFSKTGYDPTLLFSH